MSSRLRHNQFCSSGKSPKELPHRNIETERRFLENAISYSDSVLLLHPEKAIHHAPVRIHDPLGFSGGAGGVDDIGQVRGLQADSWVIAGVVSDCARTQRR